ncbi:MAG: iron ABC transporter permease [Phycisphaerales bacterium]|nr:MAG: iron ABC transporter permease [Phycisphaerales bacterium]
MTILTPRRYVLRLGGCVLGLMLLILISPGIGTESASFGWWDAWRAQLGLSIDGDELIGRPFVDLDENGTISSEELAGFVDVARQIGFRQRFPRTLLALQVGITLALCGATFQVLFRNPLATPYTLGIASGGSLGALVAIRLGWGITLLGISSLAMSAFVGGVAVVGIVLLLARGARRLTSNELLLAGVTMGLFCSAMMMLVTAVSSERATFTIVRWMMGSLDPITTLQGAMLLPLVVPSWVVLMVSARALNQYRLGDELATSRGVNVVNLQGVCVLVCTLATAGVVAKCGPIGFVGLVVPHMVALVMGSDCRLLLPTSAVVGGAFLIVCDWASQLTMRFAGWATDRQIGSATLPIGVVTAVVGVPVFLILLKARRK